MNTTYYRFKTKDGDIVQSQLITESQLPEYLKKAEEFIKQGVAVTFSTAKTSPLLSRNK